MKCIFLGTGWSVTTPDRQNTSLYLQGDDGGLLIDCHGACAQRLEAAGIAFEELEHIFITHEHPDHVGAIGNFVTQMWLKACNYRPDSRRTKPLHIHANRRTITRIEAIFAAIGLAECAHIFPRQFHALDDAGGEARLGPFAADLFPTDHNGTPCLGVALRGARRSLVYSADSEPLETLFARLADGDLLIHECNDLTLPRQTGHTTWPQLRDRLPSLPAVDLHLVHLPPVPAAVAAEIARLPRVNLATDGAVVEF